MNGIESVDHGPLFPGVIYTQENEGTVWHVAIWKGEERFFTSYNAAARWLGECRNG